MSFNWSDYHRLAENLLNNPHPPDLEEAICRSAISRAYYAAFWAAREIAAREGAPLIQGGGDHGVVKRYFKQHREDTCYKIGVALERLLNNREKADYKALETINRKLAQASVKDAAFVLETIPRLPPLP